MQVQRQRQVAAENVDGVDVGVGAAEEIFEYKRAEEDIMF